MLATSFAGSLWTGNRKWRDPGNDVVGGFWSCLLVAQSFFNSLAMLENGQLVCLLSARIFNHVMLNLNYFFVNFNAQPCTSTNVL